MRKVIGWWLVMCWAVSAQLLPQSFPGDALAKLGEYPQAEAAYRAAQSQTHDPALERRLICRRLSLAQATNDVVTAKKLGAELESKLRGQNDPEVALRVYLLRGAIAYRTRDFLAAREAFKMARPLAQALSEQRDLGGDLAMYECLSYDFLSHCAAGGRPTLAEYQQACEAAYQASQAHLLNPSRVLWPMDMYRSIVWTRLWIWQAWEYSFLDSRQKDMPGATKWANLSYGIGGNAYKVCYQGAVTYQDAEMMSASLHAALELTEGFPLGEYTGQLLQAMAPEMAKLPVNPETLFMRGRFARSWARYHFFALNDHAGALKDYQQAADYYARGGQRLDQMDVLVETAYVFCLEGAPGDWEGAVTANLEESLRLSQSYSYPLGRYYGLGFQGVLKARHGELDQAEKLLRQSLAQMSAWGRDSGESPVARSQSLQKPEVRLFSDTLVEVLLKQNRQAEAMEASQAMKAEAETAGLDLGRIVPKDQQSAQDLKELEKTRLRGGQLRAELQSAQIQGDPAVVQELQGKLASNRSEFEKTVNRLRQRDPDFEKILSVRPSSFAKLQSQLSPEVLVVEYYTSADKLVIFAATQKQLQIFSVPVGRDQLMGQVRSLRRKFLERRSLEEPEGKQLLGELYATLIGPLEPLLADHQVLAVIPSGYLYYLPFAALRKPGAGYLNEKVAVCLLTATEMPEVGGYKSAGKPTSLLALANPDGTLPGAAREVEQLAKLFAVKSTFVGDKATKDRVTDQGQVLHVATHGTLDPRDVNESYLLLAGPKGHLTAGEIYGLDLKKVSLVTLSACETALGENSPGSEVATLAQAFSFAGTRSIVASLWQVEDDSTARLMVEFYTQLLAGKSKAEALRQAQLAVMKQEKWSSPFYWAAFELIGDWH